MTARKVKSSGQLSFAFDKATAKSGSKPKKKTKQQKQKKSEKKTAVKKTTTSGKPGPKRKAHTAATAESMAAKQRDISISEFFAKNRHLLGFDNPRKALLTAVKEAVDNSLDACEEACILPDIKITIS